VVAFICFAVPDSLQHSHKACCGSKAVAGAEDEGAEKAKV